MKKVIYFLLNSIILVLIFSGCNLVGNKDEVTLESQKDTCDESTDLSKNYKEQAKMKQDNKQEENKYVDLEEHNDESFEIAYELPNSQKIYYSKARIILISKGEGYKALNNPDINDGFASFPKLSPDKKNIAYISPFEFELYGNVYIYNIEDDVNNKVVQVDYDKSDTAKVVKWLDDDRLLVIIGFGDGTVSKGGDLYLYNRLSNKTTLIKEVENKKEIVDFEIADDRIILEIITWDEDCREYTTEFEDLTFENISAAK